MLERLRFVILDCMLIVFSFCVFKFHFTGGHAWSSDGINWKWGGGKRAWTTQIRGPNGTVITLRDAERPRVWVNPKTKRPELLFVASGGARQPTTVGKNAVGFLAVQPIGTAHQVAVEEAGE